MKNNLFSMLRDCRIRTHTKNEFGSGKKGSFSLRFGSATMHFSTLRQQEYYKV